MILSKPARVVQPEIKAFLRERFDDICNPEPYNPDDHGFFILVEPGDASEQIESATGYSLLKSLCYNTVYGDPAIALFDLFSFGMRTADGQAILTSMTRLFADGVEHQQTASDRLGMLIRVCQPNE